MFMRRIAATAALMLLAGCATQGSPGGPTGSTVPGPASGGSTSPGQSPAAGPSATSTAATSRALPVYYVADTAAGLRLYREFHAVPTSDPASDAVREMLARPTGIDPDYRSHWPAGTRLRSSVQHTGATITVDL